VPAGVLQACEAAARTQEDELRAYHEARERAMAAFERQYLERLMLAAGGNVTHAARLAGKERRSLGKLLKKHGMDRGSSIA
jgi:DNA-binding NtrC family response regulator